MGGQGKLVRRRQLCGELGPDSKWKGLKGIAHWAWCVAGILSGCVVGAQCAQGRRIIGDRSENGWRLVEGAYSLF